MTLFQQKKLQTIQQKIKDLQEQQRQTEQVLAAAILKALHAQQAFSLDMNTLVGGIFHTIERIHQGDPLLPEWHKVGQAFLEKNAKARQPKDRMVLKTPNSQPTEV